MRDDSATHLAGEQFHRPRRVGFWLTPRGSSTFIGCVIGLNVLMLSGTLATSYMGETSRSSLRWASRQVNLALENNLAAWYSSMLLLAVSAVMLVCFVVERDANRREHTRFDYRRALPYGWLLFAAVFGRSTSWARFTSG